MVNFFPAKYVEREAVEEFRKRERREDFTNV